MNIKGSSRDDRYIILCKEKAMNRENNFNNITVSKGIPEDIRNIN